MPPNPAGPPRPRQATFAGWVIVIGSVLVVISAFERVSGLSSLETQESIREFLAEPPGDGLGLSFDAARETLRVLALVAGAAGVASAILGGYALMRSSGARLGLSVLALPLLVGGLAVSGLVSALVIAGVVMLWLQPATSWFAGVAPPEPRTRTPRAGSGSPSTSVPGPAPEVGAEPRPDAETPGSWPAPVAGPAPGTGQAQPPGMAWPPAATDPADDAGPAGPAGPASATVAWPATSTGLSRPSEETRPSAVFAACLVTWITSGLIALGLALTALVLLAMPGAVFDELQRQDPELLASSGADEGQLRVLTLVGCALALAWCASAVVVAIGVFRGRRWGWVGLVVSGVLCAVVSLVLMAGSLALAVPLVASATTTGLLLRSESRAWCRRRPKSRGSVSP